jgi:hypothetical protein
MVVAGAGSLSVGRNSPGERGLYCQHHTDVRDDLCGPLRGRRIGSQVNGRIRMRTATGHRPSHRPSGRHGRGFAAVHIATETPANVGDTALHTEVTRLTSAQALALTRAAARQSDAHANVQKATARTDFRLVHQRCDGHPQTDAVTDDVRHGQCPHRKGRAFTRRAVICQKYGLSHATDRQTDAERCQRHCTVRVRRGAGAAVWAFD